jgi:transcription factor TFIIIB component B''
MSTFSSVVNKSGKKFAPKATTRRNIPSRASIITPSSSDIPPPTRPSLSSIQDAANSSDALQAQSTAEQDATSLGLPSLSLQSNGLNTPLSTIPGTKSVTHASRTAESPRLTDETRKDTMKERWAANQEKLYMERVGKRQSQSQPTVINNLNDQIAHQQRSPRGPSHEHDTNPEEQVTGLGPSTRSTRSRKGGTKRKSDAQVADDPDTAPGYSTATAVLENAASTIDQGPGKHRKLGPTTLHSTSVTNLTQNMMAVSGEDRMEAPVTASAAAKASEEAPTATSRPKRKSRAKKTMQEVAAEIVADATRDTSEANEESTEGTKKRKRRWKRKIPEGAEDHEIAPSEVKMVDLVKDKRLGKGSKLEARLEGIDWDEVKKKRKEAAEEAEKQRELEREEKKTGRSVGQDDVPAAPTVPKLTVRDGQIMMEEESRIVDRHAEIEHGADEAVKVLDVDDVTRRVNQSTIGRQLGVKQKGRWNDEMTNLFYKGLRMFGTDFMMISKMFPGMSRRHIKLKYTREERTNLARINSNLIAKEDVDMEEYSQMSNQVYEDPKLVTQEIEAEVMRLRDEDLARRAREAEAEQGDDDAEDSNVLQSREQDTVEPAGGDEHETTAAETESSAKENRFEPVARSIVQRSTAPKKAKKQNTVTRKRERKKKTGLEGTEEVVGSIEDVQRE